MSFTKKYVPKQIQDVFNRIAAKNERELQSALAEPRPDTFEVVIYAYSDPQTKSQLGTEAPDAPVADTSNYYYYRAKSLAGQHDHFPAPESAKTIEEYERLRSVLYQGIIKRSANDPEPETGDVYNATFLGANLVSLDELVRTSNINTAFSTRSGAKGVFSSGNSVANILANYTTADPSQTGVVVKFKNQQAKKDYADSNKPYKSFVDKLVAKLRPLGFKADSITMNSTTRTVEAQVNAMIGTRYSTSPQFFVNWFQTQYKSATIQTELLPVIEANLSSQTQLKNAMITKVREMKNSGIYVSAHMRSGAVDLKSNNLKFEDCEVIEKALAQLVAENVVISGRWEGVADVTNGKQRRKIKVFDENEHFHITLTLANKGE